MQLQNECNTNSSTTPITKACMNWDGMYIVLLFS